MDRDNDRWVRSEEARTKLRSLMDEVENQDAHVYLLRYDRPVAVIVPVDWYENARTAVTDTSERGES